MALRFTLEQANFLTPFLTQSGLMTSAANLRNDQLMLFTRVLADGLFLSKRNVHLRSRLQQITEYSSRHPRVAFDDLRALIAELQLPWIAIFLPGVGDLDASEYFPQKFVLANSLKELPGNVLVLELAAGPLEKQTTNSIESISPVVKKVLACVTQGPGYIIWDTSLNSLFFPMGRSIDEFMSDAQWLFRRLDEIKHLPQVWKEFFYRPDKKQPVVTRILHLSDLHLGHELAQKNLPRLKQLIGTTISEFPDDTIIPVLTGDLMHTPNEPI